MSISYQYRTYIAIFLPFRAYSIDNQLIIDTQADFSSIFQFHKGTIETQPLATTLRPILHFNSIKVRLKPTDAVLQGGVAEFQFHKGTIETVNGTGEDGQASLFQFHKGTIETLVFESAASVETHFNSIKVRLKPLKELQGVCV